MKNLILFYFIALFLFSCEGEVSFQEKVFSIAKWQLENTNQNPFVYKRERSSCEVKTLVVDGDTTILFKGIKKEEYLNTVIFVSGKNEGKIMVEDNLNIERDKEQLQKKITKNMVDVFYDQIVKEPGD